MIILNDQESKKFLKNQIEKFTNLIKLELAERKRIFYKYADFNEQWVGDLIIDGWDHRAFGRLQHCDGINDRIRKYTSQVNRFKWHLRNLSNPQAEPENIIDLIARAKQVPIYRAVEGAVKLRKAGVNYTGLCPFHSEKTPSFTVFSKNNRFKCFGCGESGDIIDLVCKTQNLKLHEAIKYILNL